MRGIFLDIDLTEVRQDWGGGGDNGMLQTDFVLTFVFVYMLKRVKIAVLFFDFIYFSKRKENRNF
jgi:hypothetical protein